MGDAAAQVKVSTVGGIVTGFRGALGVAEAILNGGASRELRSLRRELDFHLLLRRSLHGFQQSDYSYLVDLLNNPAQGITRSNVRATKPGRCSGRYACASRGWCCWACAG